MVEERLVLRIPAALPASMGALPKDWRTKLEEALLGLWNALESEHSRRGYRDDWRRWIEWLLRENVHPLEVRPLQVQQYLAELAEAQRSKATRARALAVIRAVYAAIVVSGLMQTNPAREVKNIKVSADPKTPWLSADELAVMLVRPPSDAPWHRRRDWMACIILVGTGWRRSEVARFQRSQLIDVPGGYSAKVRAKGGKEAIVPLPRWLSSELLEWFRIERIFIGAVLPSRPGGPAIGPGTVRNAVKRAAADAGVDEQRATPHAIRRSFATIARQRGIPLEDVQQAMLHSSRATTERYDHGAKLPEAAPGEALSDLIPSRNQ